MDLPKTLMSICSWRRSTLRSTRGPKWVPMPAFAITLKNFYVSLFVANYFFQAHAPRVGNPSPARSIRVEKAEPGPSPS